ncbi:hypothetical protein ABPG72_004413 [Tetrahymena utriculariae]
MGTGNDKMQTSFGGILTLFIIVASILYFTYLNYMQISGNILPKMLSQEKKIAKNFSLPIQTDLLWFDISNSITDENLMNKQKNLNQQLITYKAILQQSDSNGKRINDIVIPVDFCSNLTDSPLVDQTAQCLDFSGLAKELAQFELFVAQGFNTRIYIELVIVRSGGINTYFQLQIFEDSVFGDDVNLQFLSKNSNLTLIRTIQIQKQSN